MNDSGSDSLSEFNDANVANDTRQTDLRETLNQTWKNFTLKKSAEPVYHFLKAQKKSIFSDICIRVEESEFHLDRVILISKSNYFDQLSLPKESSRHYWEDMIDAAMSNYGITSERFSLVVDIMYGKDLESAINEQNFVELLKDMDFLKMEIELEVFKQFVYEKIKPKIRFNVLMFELYDFLLSNYDRFNYFLPTVTEYISDRLSKAGEEKEFLSVSMAGLVRILRNSNGGQVEENGLIGRICAEWICHDFDSRILHLKDLVNATKYRYGCIRYCILDTNVIVEALNGSNDDTKVETVEKYFNKLLFYDGEFAFQLNDESGNEVQNHYVNLIDPKTKWAQILEKKWSCDVIVVAQKQAFYLHRIKLSSESQYFHDRFTSSNELRTDSGNDGESSKSNMKQHFLLNDITKKMFEMIISYIHFNEIEITSETQLIRLLIASKILDISDLFEKCNWKVLQITHLFSQETIFELFNFVCVSMKYTTLYRVLFKRLIQINSHPKLRENPHFKFFTLDVVRQILTSPELAIDDPNDILDLCSEWICEDIQTRHRYTIELANVINRNFMLNGDQFVNLETPSTSNLNSPECPLQFVKNQLVRILSANKLVPLFGEYFWKTKPQPRFIVSKQEGILSITDIHFNEIALIQLKISSLLYSETAAKVSQPRATLIDDKLFITFNIEKKFYFQVYDFSSGKLISLATDSRMQTNKRYFLLNCQDRVFFCAGRIILEYSFLLNRWFTVTNDQKGTSHRYTSDGRKLYRVYVEKAKGPNDKTIVKADFLDLDSKTWNTLPDVPVNITLKVQTIAEPRPDGSSNAKTCWMDPPPIKMDIINNEITLLTRSRTYSFNWTCQTWNYIPNGSSEFYDFTGHEQKILFVSLRRNVYSYSPATQNKWTLVKMLSEVKDIVAIHTVQKCSLGRY